MNETTARPPDPDPVHVARIRLFRAWIARRLLAIPPDCSKQSRTARLVHIDRGLKDFAREMASTVSVTPSAIVTLQLKREWKRWYWAAVEAWSDIHDARDAGESLDRFLFPAD